MRWIPVKRFIMLEMLSKLYFFIFIFFILKRTPLKLKHFCNFDFEESFFDSGRSAHFSSQEIAGNEFLHLINCRSATIREGCSNFDDMLLSLRAKLGRGVNKFAIIFENFQSRYNVSGGRRRYEMQLRSLLLTV